MCGGGVLRPWSLTVVAVEQPAEIEAHVDAIQPHAGVDVEGLLATGSAHSKGPHGMRKRRATSAPKISVNSPDIQARASIAGRALPRNFWAAKGKHRPCLHRAAGHSRLMMIRGAPSRTWSRAFEVITGTPGKSEKTFATGAVTTGATWGAGTTGALLCTMGLRVCLRGSVACTCTTQVHRKRSFTASSRQGSNSTAKGSSTSDIALSPTVPHVEVAIGTERRLVVLAVDTGRGTAQDAAGRHGPPLRRLFTVWTACR